jgi:rSAM/selenodomain-associated transferase 1
VGTILHTWRGFMDINRVTGDRCDIAVFARAPVPGEAKTRLIPALGAEGAAALHRRMVRDILAKARAAGLGRVTLWGAPDVSHASFAESATAFGVELRAQGPGDLGARMEAAFHSTLPLLLVGSDCPSIEPSDLRACAAALQSGADAVFLPAEDGGYGLVGLARP